MAPFRSDDENSVKSPTGVTGRILFLSLALILFLCWWIVYSEMRTTTTEITSTSLPIGVVFILFVVCIINVFVKRRWPEKALRPSELGVLYILTAVGSSLAGIGMVGFLLPAIANPIYYNNNVNGWRKIADHAPFFWGPKDREAVLSFYNGNSTIYKVSHILAWVPSLTYWGLFLFALMGFFLCLALLLRRQWIERERLSYPIVILPIEMATYPGGFDAFMLRKAMLIGFFIPVILQSINSLNYLIPSIPFIPLKPTQNGPLDLGPLFTQPPWNALGYFPLAFHPNTIGLAYLLPADVSFSCWFFYLLRKGLDVACTAFGWRSPQDSPMTNRLPYSPEQGVGAWLMLAVMTIWLARRDLMRYARAAFFPRREAEPDAAALRKAVWGAILCYLVMIGMVWQGGLPLSLTLLMLGIMTAFLIALTRIRIEAGTAWEFGTLIPVQEVVAHLVGPATLSPTSVSVLAFHEWYNLDYRSFTVPSLFEAYKVAQTNDGKPMRRLTGAMILCIVFGFVISCWAALNLYYTYGAASAHVNPWRIQMGQIPWNLAQSHLQSLVRKPDWPGIEGMAAGAVITMLLFVARSQFLWWPFHPAGYAIGNTFITDLLWFPFFLGWLCKIITLRYGGMSAYKKALPFFIGLILGDYFIASVWSLAGVAFHLNMYRCFPN